MEEMISILEESDRSAQQALGSLEARYSELANSCESLFIANDDTQRRLQDQAMHMNSELQKSHEAQQQMLSEMFLVFDKQLEKLSAELNHKMDSLAARTSEDNHLLANDLIRRVQQLAEESRADNDKVASVLEARLARSEAHAEKENRRHIEVFADGFSDIADRLLALRGVQNG
jgi:predicted transcriptional regulator